MSIDPVFPGFPRRAGVIGAGAMGCTLAAVLGQTADVVMVLRDPYNAERIRSEGVRVGGLHVAHARPAVVRHIAGLPSDLDVVFVATKTTAIDAVAADLHPVLGRAEREPPFIVSFQNGIEPGRRLIECLGSHRVLRMVLNYGARLAEDGTAIVTYSRPPHALGCLDSGHRAACAALAASLTAGGMETAAVEDIEPLVWFKGIINAAMNPVAALMNARVGDVLESPAVSIVERLIDEGLQVAEAERIDLGADAGTRMMSVLAEACGHTPSMVEDIRAGYPSEIGQLNVQIVEHAETLGIPTPAHDLISTLIEAFDWRVFHGAVRASPSAGLPC